MSEGLAELEAPLSDSLFSEGDVTRHYHLLDIAVALSEAEVKPHLSG